MYVRAVAHGCYADVWRPCVARRRGGRGLLRAFVSNHAGTCKQTGGRHTTPAQRRGSYDEVAATLASELREQQLILKAHIQTFLAAMREKKWQGAVPAAVIDSCSKRWWQRRPQPERHHFVHAYINHLRNLAVTPEGDLLMERLCPGMDSSDRSARRYYWAPLSMSGLTLTGIDMYSKLVTELSSTI